MRKKCAAGAEVLRIERSQPPARIAAEHGFSNPSRSAQLFRRSCGAYPSRALRARSEG
jgi:AraC-like DNA-binding protein